MKAIRFRKEAETDLRGIVEWYEETAPHAVENILADIYRSIDQLTRYPASGMQVPGRSFRRIVTLKFHFKVAYEVADDFVTIIGIYRYQNRDK